MSKERIAHDPLRLALTLPGYYTAIISQARREYSEPWTDWAKPNEPANKEPVVYALWDSLDVEILLYIGQTSNLWKRLSEHFHDKNWKTRPRYVSFIELPEFKYEIIVTLVEKFLVAAMNPIFNDHRK